VKTRSQIWRALLINWVKEVLSCLLNGLITLLVIAIIIAVIYFIGFLGSKIFVSGLVGDKNLFGLLNPNANINNVCGIIAVFTSFISWLTVVITLKISSAYNKEKNR